MLLGGHALAQDLPNDGQEGDNHYFISWTDADGYIFWNTRVCINGTFVVDSGSHWTNDSGLQSDYTEYLAKVANEMTWDCGISQEPDDEDDDEDDDGDKEWMCEGGFCYRPGGAGDPFEYESTCDADSSHREHGGPDADRPGNETLNEHYEQCKEESEPDEPPPPEDPPPECTGAEGVACEDTQRQNRDFLEQILEELRDQNDATPAPNVPPAEPEAPDLSVPSFPETGIPVEGIPEPDEDGGWMDDLSGRMTTRLESLQTTASGKMPFALGGWIPVLSVGGASECQEIEITLLETETDLGWCSSPMYTFLTTIGRGASLFLIMIGFYLAVSRTVAWA